jgi:hypothetical protein
MTIALAAVAFAAPPAHASVLTGEGSSDHGQVLLGGGNGVSAQVADTGGGLGISGQVATGHGAGSFTQVSGIGGGQGASGQTVRESNSGFSWMSALLAGSALAALGAVGAAISRRPQRRTATLSI